MLRAVYTVKHDDPDWPADIDPTISTHTYLDEAIRTLELALDRHAWQLTAFGESGAVLSLVVVDPAGRDVVSAASNATHPGTVRFSFADDDAHGWPPLP